MRPYNSFPYSQANLIFYDIWDLFAFIVRLTVCHEELILYIDEFLSWFYQGYVGFVDWVLHF